MNALVKTMLNRYTLRRNNFFMRDEQKTMELYKQQREMQQKYIYFILAINASAMGYSIQLTINKHFQNYYLVLFGSIVSWGFSFYSGCKYLLDTMKLTGINMALLDRDYSNKKQMEIEINDIGKKASKRFNRMFIFLIIGVCFFIGWYVLLLTLKPLTETIIK